jgi:hypothetical protein
VDPIAAGYGHIVIKALEAGARTMFANEVDARPLAIIKARTLSNMPTSWSVVWGNFRSTSTDASFDGIYNARPFTSSMAIAFGRA